MIRNEEIYATQLYQELKNEFGSKGNSILKFLRPHSKSNIAIALKLAGTQSYCTISKEDRQCSIHCFDIDMNNVQYKGPEFYTSFISNEKSLANGRTFDRRQTMDAVKSWIENSTIEELYSKFSFVDEKKRQLQNIRTDINALNPKLPTISRNEVAEQRFSSYSLWFKNNDRSCRIYYYGYESNPRYLFYWDDALVFETSGSDVKRLGHLIIKWVLEKEMPSTLNKEFPEISFGKLAEYYEKGNGVEGEFILSWDHIETFFLELELDKKNEILELIKQMRAKGFDRTLRAGQSLYTLILSRSRRHGLREDQNSVSFSFNYIKSAMEVRTRKGEKLQFDKIEYNETIENLLREIEVEKID